MAEKTVSERLQGLKGDALRAVARDMGVYPKSRMSDKAIREAISKEVVASAYQGSKMVTVEASGGGGMSMNTKPMSAAEAGAGAARGRAAAEGQLDKAIEKVRAAAPAKAPKASRTSKSSKAQADFYASRSATPKTKGLPAGERVAKLSMAVDNRVRAKGQGNWSTDDIKRRNARIDRITDAAGLTNHRGRSVQTSPAPKGLLMPGPGQPAGTLTNAQKMAMVKSHGLGGALVASQFPTHPAGYRPSSGPLARKIDTVGAVAKGLDRLSKDLATPAAAGVPAAAPKPSAAPARSGISARGKIGIALGVAAAAAALYGAMKGSGSKPASSGSGRGPAAPESSKSRTDPYTDSLGRNYANGRLIVRDK